MTGDWEGAVGGIEAFKNRALQMNVPLSAMVERASSLTMLFGMKSTSQVETYFGNIDAGARKAGVSISLADKMARTFEERFASMGGGADAGKFSALSTGMLEGTKSDRFPGGNMGLASGSLGYGLDAMEGNLRFVEQRMRRAGLLGKGKYLSGDFNDTMKTLQFMQKDIVREHGGNLDRAVEIEAGEGAGALQRRREIRNFLTANLNKARDMAGLNAEINRPLADFNATAAGAREVSNVQKQLRDIDLGMTGLPMQDRAVSMGGGLRGMGIGAGADLFNTGLGAFGGIALKGAGRLLGGAAGRALSIGGGALASTAGLAAGALFMSGDNASQAQARPTYAPWDRRAWQMPAAAPIDATYHGTPYLDAARRGPLMEFEKGIKDRPLYTDAGAGSLGATPSGSRTVTSIVDNGAFGAQAQDKMQSTGPQDVTFDFAKLAEELRKEPLRVIDASSSMDSTGRVWKQ
jgi:hypothetical protein